MNHGAPHATIICSNHHVTFVFIIFQFHNQDILIPFIVVQTPFIIFIFFQQPMDPLQK